MIKWRQKQVEKNENDNITFDLELFIKKQNVWVDTVTLFEVI